MDNVVSIKVVYISQCQKSKNQPLTELMFSFKLASEIREILLPANSFCWGGNLYVLIKHDVPLKTGSFLPNIHSFCSCFGVKFLHFRRHLFWLTIFDIIWQIFLQMGWNHHLATSCFLKLSMFKCCNLQASMGGATWPGSLGGRRLPLAPQQVVGLTHARLVSKVAQQKNDGSDLIFENFSGADRAHTIFFPQKWGLKPEGIVVHNLFGPSFLGWVAFAGVGP